MYLSTDDLAGQLVDLIAAQVRILLGDDVGESVVLSGEQGMHRDEPDLLVHSDIAGNKQTRQIATPFVVESLLVEWQESPFVRCFEPSRSIIGAKCQGSIFF